MNDLDLNHIQNIESLQQKIESYKETLNALKNNDVTDELNHLKKKMNDTEQLMETMNHQQEIEFKKYTDEISMLSEQLYALNQTVYELIEKVSTFIEGTKQIQPETERSTTKLPTTKPATSSNIPSFQQLHQLLADPQPFENSLPETNEEKNIKMNEKNFQNNHFPTSSPISKPKARLRQSMHNFNMPSAKKKFSVILDSMAVSPFHTDMKPPPIPEEPQISEEPQTVENFVKEEVLFEEEPITKPSPTNQKETSSLLNFFRKR